MACDSAVWIGDITAHDITKIFRVHGSLIGAAGTVADIQLFLKWIRNGADEDEFPRLHGKDLQALVVDKCGVIRAFEHSSPTPMRVKAEYCAIGGGAEFALGAMYAGADAVTAVKAARKHHSQTSGRIKSYWLFP